MKAKIIFCVACFYDLDDPGEFLEAVKLALHPEGIFIVQMNYLGTMLRNLCVDNICHEHVTYYSARSFQRLLEAHGLTITEIEMNNVNGGSARFYIRLGGEVPASVRMALEAEPANDWQKFSEGLGKMRRSVLTYLATEQVRGKKLAICGASTRGLALLHFLGLGKETFRLAGDRDPEKHGRYYGATGIPILSEKATREYADIMLVLPWHFADEIVKREEAWLGSGGELLLPLPKPRVVRSKGTEWL